jgi:hypothetical protein
MRRVVGGLAHTAVVTTIAVALVLAVAVATPAGENETTKWHKAGFACVFNQDGTSNCRFEVDARNKLERRDWFKCKVRVEFTTVTWKGYTARKRISAGDWKRFGAEAEQVPEGEIVDKIKWHCWRIA